MYTVQSIHYMVKYSGEYCDFKATRKGSLNIHVQYIPNRVKYSGEYCVYKGTRKGNLNIHEQ